MREEIWQLDAVTVRGSHRCRLENVSLTIPAGMTAVLGPSGSGKTTLLNLLVGYEKPDLGTIEFVCKPDSRLPLFWCPPDDGLWPHMTVREHLRAVAPGGSTLSTDTLLSQFDLQDQAAVKPDRLSQGQRARLSVARALSSGAGVLVMDEPLEHVGRRAAERYWEVVRRHVVEQGVSIVFSTHDERVAESEAQHAVSLDEGRVVSQGPISSVLEYLRGPVFAGLLLCVSLLAGCDLSGDAELPVGEVKHHAMLSDGMKVPAPRCIVPGPDGQYIVLDNAGRLLVMNEAGEIVRQWYMPEHKNGKPEGACVLADGRIAVADTHYYRVVFFNADGTVHSMLGELGKGPGQFKYPIKVITDPSGNLYVAEYGGNDRVQKFSPDGKHLLDIGSSGAGQGQFQRPSGIVWHDGKLYVADAINNRIQVFSDDGKFLRVMNEKVPLRLPYDLARGPDGLFYAVEYSAGRLTAMTEEGELVGRFGSPGGGSGQLSTPWGLTVGSNGTVWIADTGNRRIVEVKR